VRPSSQQKSGYGGVRACNFSYVGGIDGGLWLEADPGPKSSRLYLKYN
jgi:hypothetical protein